MAAVAYPQVYPPHSAPPARVRRPEVLPPPLRGRRAALLRRRRRVAALLLGTVLLLSGRAGLALFGAGPVAGSAHASGFQPAADRVYVVEPGDTVWGIAHRLQPTGDERPLVDRLTAELGGEPLQVGQTLTLP